MYKDLAVAQQELAKVFNGRFDSTDPDHPLGISIVLSGGGLEKCQKTPVFLALTKLSDGERAEVQRQLAALKAAGHEVAVLTDKDKWGLAMSGSPDFNDRYWFAVGETGEEITADAVNALRTLGVVH